jgi:hypothetical protein
MPKLMESVQARIGKALVVQHPYMSEMKSDWTKS